MVVVGNVGVDTKVLPGSAAGKETVFTDVLDCVGHAGGYAARGYAALGRRTAVLGHVGDDPLGRWVRDELEADGIEVHLDVDPAGTARSVNHLAADGSRRNYYDARGHMTLDAPEFDFTGVRLAHVHLANWTRTLLPAMENVTIAADLQDVSDPADPYRADHVEHADVLFFSAADADPDRIMDAWDRPGRVIVAGLGPRGARVSTEDGRATYPPAELDLPVVDTDGAGDALAVGFLPAHGLDGMPVEDAIHHGLIAARWACGQRGSTTLITRDQLSSAASPR